MESNILVIDCENYTFGFASNILSNDFEITEIREAQPAIGILSKEQVDPALDDFSMAGKNGLNFKPIPTNASFRHFRYTIFNCYQRPKQRQ